MYAVNSMAVADHRLGWNSVLVLFVEGASPVLFLPPPSLLGVLHV